MRACLTSFFNPLRIAYLKKFSDSYPNKKSLSTTC